MITLGRAGVTVKEDTVNEELGEEFDADAQPALIISCPRHGEAEEDPVGTRDLLTHPVFCPWGD